MLIKIITPESFVVLHYFCFYTNCICVLRIDYFDCVFKKDFIFISGTDFIKHKLHFDYNCRLTNLHLILTTAEDLLRLTSNNNNLKVYL